MFAYTTTIPAPFRNVTDRPGASVLLEHQFVHTGMYVFVRICMWTLVNDRDNDVM